MSAETAVVSLSRFFSVTGIVHFLANTSVTTGFFLLIAAIFWDIGIVIPLSCIGYGAVAMLLLQSIDILAAKIVRLTWPSLAAT